MKEFYSQLIKLSGFGVGGLLTFSGKKAGKIAGSYLEKLVERENPTTEEVLPYMSVFLEETGICQVEAYEKQEDSLLIKVKGSIFAEGVENKKPVCMPLSGALAGLLEEITGRAWECKELECQAQGKDMCLFEIKAK